MLHSDLIKMERNPVIDNKKRLIKRYCKNYGFNTNIITYDMIIQHWDLERELAKQMQAYSGPNRAYFFKDCYQTLYTSCPWLVSTGISENRLDDWRDWWINSIGLPKDAKILEIGGGAGNSSKRIGNKGFFVTSIDLSEQRIGYARQNCRKSNVSFQVGDAVNLDFPHETFDAVYSHQMIEHLHPDDVPLHIKGVYDILKKGGYYYFTTPNGLWGPTDVSRVFGCKKACGMHLKEYSYSEIIKILHDSGFNDLNAPILHPFICDRLGFRPPLMTGERKGAWESYLCLLPKLLNNLIRIAGVDSIMIIARK